MTSSAAAVSRTDGPSARAERPIVVGIDGSPGSVAALRWAASEARAHGRPLTAVVAYDVPAYYGYPLAPVPELDDAQRVGGEACLDKALADVYGDKRPPEVRREVQQGNPARVLIDIAQDASLLVVGARGHGHCTVASGRHAVGYGALGRFVLRHGQRRDRRYDELVSDVADRADERFVLGPELRAQPAHVHVDRPCAAVVVIAPDLLQQLGAGKHPARVLGQVLEQLELLEGQVERSVAQPAGIGDLVDPKVAGPNHGLLGRSAAADGAAGPGGDQPQSCFDLGRSGGDEQDVVDAPLGGQPG